MVIQDFLAQQISAVSHVTCSTQKFYVPTLHWIRIITEHNRSYIILIFVFACVFLIPCVFTVPLSSYWFWFKKMKTSMIDSARPTIMLITRVGRSSYHQKAFTLYSWIMLSWFPGIQVMVMKPTLHHLH